MSSKYILEMNHIEKDFFGNKVLKDVSIKVKPGEIVALIGENGAGKSTIMNILFGMPAIQQTGGFKGSVLIDGEEVNIKSPIEAMKYGIGMVHQHFMLARPMTVVENVMLGKKSRRGILLDTKETATELKELADKYNVGLHMHVAEVKDEVEYMQATRGEWTVTHLNKLGVLDKNFLAVHTVWLTNEEVEMFRDHQVKVSHNPAAAMRVLGFAKVPRMLREGICVTIGTDGAPSNNRMDMVDEMYLTSLIHKGWRLEPDVVKAQEILRMATINGAKALMDEELYGSLEVGKKADLIVINPDSAGMLPLHDPVANLVTSMHSSNVESTMCDGKWLMKDRIVLSLNEEEVLAAAKEHAAAIRSRAGIELPDRFPVVYPMSSK